MNSDPIFPNQQNDRFREVHEFLSKKRTLIFLSIFIIIVVLIGGFALYLNQLRFDNRSKAGINCEEPLELLTSLDGINFSPSSSVTFSKSYPKYYLKFIACGEAAVNVNLDAFSRYCADINSCDKEFTVSSPWYVFITDSQGIVRVDSAFFNLESGVYEAQYRIHNGRFQGWGPKVQFVVSNDSTRSSQSGFDLVQTYDLSRYFMNTPGNSYIYTSTNNILQSTGTTVLQIEAPTNVCGQTTTPWRFMKNTPQAFWDPSVSANQTDRFKNLRWFVANSDFGQDKFPTLIWATSGKTYRSHTGETGIVNLNDSDFFDYLSYATSNKALPAYYLGAKSVQVPSSYTNNGGSSYKSLLKDGCPILEVNREETGIDWKTRIDKANITIDKPNFKYTGEALRVDYYEGVSPIEQQRGIRESWYFVKDVGPVKIETKYFNGYASAPYIDVSKDPDYYADNMKNPHVVVELDDYYLASETPIVSVSTDGIRFSDSVTVSEGQGYYVKVDNVRSSGTKSGKYSGYLEAKDDTGRVFKWSSPGEFDFPVINGVAYVKPDLVRTLPKKTYTANYRIWTPNDNFPGESRIDYSNPSPWSNKVTIVLQ